MAPDPTPQTPALPAAEWAAWEARKLLRAARAGALATVADGPYAALVTPATAPDGSVLLLLSGLSEHTRQLRADPRFALLVAGVPAEANPQTAPRATFTGLAEPVEAAAVPALKARYLAVHPYAALYADFDDFALWRLRPIAAQFVGGFATAVRLRRQQFTPDPAAVVAVEAASASIMAHVNADHADALAAIARAAGSGAGDWRMVGVDVDGCDLSAGEAVLRIAWSAPVADAGGVRTELVRFAREARGG
jgi:putative heme iron utilization protein